MENKLSFHERFAAVQNELFVDKLGKNPHFKSEFFRLGDILLSLRLLLHKNRLMVIQRVLDNKLQTIVTDLENREERVMCSFDLPAIADIQKLSAAITYIKRISLTAIFLIEERDDDGETANGRDESPGTDAGNNQVSNKPDGNPKIGAQVQSSNKQQAQKTPPGTMPLSKNEASTGGGIQSEVLKDQTPITRLQEANLMAKIKSNGNDTIQFFDWLERNYRTRDLKDLSIFEYEQIMEMINAKQRK